MNVVALVGRPNVGKSTLFNRLIGEKRSIVESIPGVTRDRLYGESFWNGKNFSVVDTGGFIPSSANDIEKAVREQAMEAIAEANAIIFVCDGRDGPTAFDQEIAKILRQSSKPTVVAVNKCDNSVQDNFAYDFYSLGLGEPFPISALNGRGTGEMLDEIAKHLKDFKSEESDPRLKIAFVGRPNVGKSSLTNAFLGENRAIVDGKPGTTRDAVDSLLKFRGEEIVIIDTAGLRRRSRIKENVEMFSVIRTSRAIERADVVAVLIDAVRGLEEQDKRIINQAIEARKGTIAVFNKWDLVEKDHKTADEYKKAFYEELKTLYYLPVYFVSAKTKQRIVKILEEAIRIKERRQTRISTAELNRVLSPEFERTPPPAVRGRDLRINYVVQTKTEPPLFVFFTNYPDLMPDSYKRFIEKTLRKRFDFFGTPISLLFRRKNVKWEDR